MKKQRIGIALLAILMISSSFINKNSPPTDFKEIKYFYIWSLFNGNPEKNYKKEEIHFFISNVIRTDAHDIDGLQNAFIKQMSISNKWAVRAYIGEKAGGYPNIEDAVSARQIMIKENIQKGYIIHYVKW